MKRIFLLIFILAFSLVSCSGSTSSDINNRPSLSLTSSPSLDKSELTDGSIDENYSIVSQLNFFNALDMSNRYYNLLDWENYIQEKFGIELYIDYADMYPNSIFYLSENGLTGFSDKSAVFNYGNKIPAYNIKPYYDKYRWDRFIDQKYIDALTIDGAIYAVPTAAEKYIVPRYYNLQYLSELAMDIPTNTDELYKFLKGAKSLNANDSTFYPMCVSRQHTLQSTSDIFRAYGAFVGSEFNVTCSFNPNTGTYEDASFSKEFEGALEFIRSLQYEDLLVVHGSGYHESSESYNIFMGDLLKINKKFATELMYVYDDSVKGFIYFPEAEPLYDKEEGYYLVHSNLKNVCEVRSDMSFYTFRSNNNNINGVMDLFNQVMTDSGFYADLRYGIEGREYILSDDGIIPQKPEMGLFPGIKQIIPPDDQYAMKAPKSLSIMENLAQDMFFEYSIFTNPSVYFDQRNSLRAGGNFYDVLFCDTVSARDAIDEFRKLFKEAGLVQVVYDLNERIGETPVYKYE